MSKIKVGQVWEYETRRFVITHEYRHRRTNLSYYAYAYIYQDGDTEYDREEEIKKLKIKLLAEYPTWQEAINSEEFRNDR